ncbi:acetyl-CoA acetyltransferase [Mycolicibacterium chubuense NBB4]|uniref:Acetyl-CoA acetyltransferase n=1 Tax=Mycolicibacterium chubuense (strain NBB4) TaxID=710421 RepID=I4BKA2_MYCCN|nr:thiolase family protein [Mycolicibacterium chubuense]AFM17709.1 acetyl-CoA acetyltransferase [Mycolicibacterium chubuense NBB4]
MSARENRAVISGIGQSDIGRRLGRDELDLTIDAALAAIADAGLTVADIDGLATYPGGLGGYPGFSGPGSPVVHDALRLQLNWHSGGAEGPAQLQAVVNAAMAVSQGLARHVLVYRTVTESTAQGSGRRPGIGLDDGQVTGALQWTIPFRAYSAANWLAMYAMRHFHEFGTTERQLAQIALNGRRNAALNDTAIFREPLTMDDYLAARMISTPFRLFDCDVPVDGSTALIVSTVEHADSVDHPVARIDAVGTALRGRPSWEQWDDLTTMPARTSAAQMWSRTDLRPADVDVAELYDGFSWLTMSWLEALGFCGHGESGPFIEGGGRIALDGELPVNTHGGQLSAGRLHGYGFLHEAVLQLRGEAGARQVAGTPEVAVVSNGGGPVSGCLLLTRLA